MKVVVVVIGSGKIGHAIAWRVAVAKHLVIADVHEENASAAAGVLASVGYEISVATADVSKRDEVRSLVEAAARRGDIAGLIHAAGVSPRRRRPRRFSTSIFMARHSYRKSSAR
jgi:NAD(P)-dependent dehydrogenase (short-subunit alcohol dehydrogenase family)